MNKIVLIGDIVSSRKAYQRGKLQVRLKNVLNKLNKNNSNLASLYTVTLGDEFQAVFNNANSLFYETIEILSAVYPEKVRFSFGVGSIVTNINYEQALGMDGPAFHFARQGIDELKDVSCLYKIVWPEHPQVNLLNKSLCLYSHFCRNWNLNRFQTLALIYQNYSVLEIANKLHISDKAVYKTIDAGSLTTVHELLDEIATMVNGRIS